MADADTDQKHFHSINIPREDYERHKPRKEELGLTWAEYIDGQAPDLIAKVSDALAEAAETDDGLAYDAVKQAAREGVEEALAAER